MAITLGPLIGHTTKDSVTVWIRGKKESKNSKRYCYGAADLYKGKKLVQSKYCYLKDYYDFTGFFNFSELSPGTKYRVRVHCIHKEDRRAPIVRVPVEGPVAGGRGSKEGEFVTAGTVDTTKIRFLFGSCRYLFWDNILHSDAAKGDKAFRSIKELHKNNPLDLMLMVGDQVYADPLNIIYANQTIEGFFNIYRKTYEQKHFRDLVAKVPTYMVLDDHEIEDNWSKDRMNEGKGGLYQVAMRAYHAYQHIHNPDTPNGQLWYNFEWGAFPFFVMDVRSQRLNRKSTGNPKTMLGREQMNAFLNWLDTHKKSPAKFVVSSVPFFPDLKQGRDKWSAFEDDRSAILETIRLEKVKGVIFLSGDVHNSSFAHMYCHQDPKLKVVSLVSSPFYWPYPHESKSAFYPQRTIAFDQRESEKTRSRNTFEYRYEGEGFINDESFVVVDLNASTGTVTGSAEAFGRKGSSLYKYDFSFK